MAIKSLIIRKKKGFTLAEILVTLGVIGVIASMTVPTLVQDLQDAQFKTAWKKAFSDYSQATKKLISDNGGSLKGVFHGTDNYTFHNSMLNKYSEYLIMKKCTDSKAEGCWHADSRWTALDGSSRILDVRPGGMLNNGILLFMGGSNIDTNCPSGVCGQIYTDINGFKSPNKIGKDIFILNIYQNTIKSACDSNMCENSTGIYSGCGCGVTYLYQ